MWRSAFTGSRQCVCFVHWWFSVGFFTKYYPPWFFPLIFPLVDVGRHPPKSVLWVLPPALVCFVLSGCVPIVRIMTLSI